MANFHNRKSWAIINAIYPFNVKLNSTRAKVIQNGQTGYLAEPDNKEILLSYVEVIEKIKRKNCREWVEKNASTDIFANKVLNWLNKVIKEYK